MVNAQGRGRREALMKDERKFSQRQSREIVYENGRTTRRKYQKRNDPMTHVTEKERRNNDDSRECALFVSVHEAWSKCVFFLEDVSCMYINLSCYSPAHPGCSHNRRCHLSVNPSLGGLAPLLRLAGLAHAYLRRRPSFRSVLSL